MLWLISQMLFGAGSLSRVAILLAVSGQLGMSAIDPMGPHGTLRYSKSRTLAVVVTDAETQSVLVNSNEHVF